MDLRSTRDWTDILERLPVEFRDAFLLPAYLSLHSTEGEPDCTVCTEGDHTLIVPGVRIAIPGTTYADLQSPNGYGGPLLSPSAPADFVERAWRAWREDARGRHVVAAFFRLHPLLRNRDSLPADHRLQRDRPTAYVDLSKGLATAWASADTRHRNMVNRGRRVGIQTVWNDPRDWTEFEFLYRQAMVRLNAEERLLFASDYFESLKRLPGAELVSARDAEGLLAANLFLWGPVWGHYHLAARRPDAPNFAMNLLLQSGIERAHARGLSGLHLGGGATTSEKDGVFRFKRSVGTRLLEYEVALVIADVGRYTELVREWEQREGRAPAWLLGYRQASCAGSRTAMENDEPESKNVQ